MSGATYKSRLRRATWLAFGGAVIAGLIVGRIARSSAPGENFWLIFPLLLLVGALALLGTWPWWRRIDDIQKNGHMLSWYWGSTVGAVILLMWVIAATGVNSDVTKGATAMFMAQGLGFLVVFGSWSWRGRGAAE
jgi:hypothetical protein